MATHALLLRDIINQTLRCTGDYVGTGFIAGKTWTRSQVVIAINQSLLEWSRRTGFLRGVSTVSIVDATKTYSLPDTCLRLLRIGFYDDNACAWVAEPTTITAQDMAYLTITGSTYPFYHFLEYLAYNKFGFQPTPGDDLTAYLSFIRSHTYLSTETDYPEDAIPTWFHKDIKFGASRYLLAESREEWRKTKKKYCDMKWEAKIAQMTTIKQYHGPDHGVMPV
jgi:hypothetical protein